MSHCLLCSLQWASEARILTGLFRFFSQHETGEPSPVSSPVRYAGSAVGRGRWWHTGRLPLGSRTAVRYGRQDFSPGKETSYMAMSHSTLTQLAQQAAAQIGFLPCRWWCEKTDPQVLRVEVERRLVGAPPAIAVLTVTIPPSLSSRYASPAPVASPARSRPATYTTRRTTGTRHTAREFAKLSGAPLKKCFRRSLHSR